MCLYRDRYSSVFVCLYWNRYSQSVYLLQILDEEAEVFVVKMWRLLVYETEAKKLGLVKWCLTPVRHVVCCVACFMVWPTLNTESNIQAFLYCYLWNATAWCGLCLVVDDFSKYQNDSSKCSSTDRHVLLRHFKDMSTVCVLLLKVHMSSDCFYFLPHNTTFMPDSLCW